MKIPIPITELIIVISVIVVGIGASILCRDFYISYKAIKLEMYIQENIHYLSPEDRAEFREKIRRFNLESDLEEEDE